MKKVWIVFIMAFLQLYNVSAQSCKVSDDCQLNYRCQDGLCYHKDLFPIEAFEMLLLLIMIILSLVATTAGIGGGVVYASLLMFFSNFHAKQAFSVSNFVILFCSLSSFYVGLRRKLENPQLKFIDFNLAAIFCPTQLLGTKMGVILNKIFPEIFLNLMFILVLSVSMYKTFLNAMNQRKKELASLLELHTKLNQDFLSPRVNAGEQNTEETNLTVPYDALAEDRYPIKVDIIKALFLFEFFLIVDQLLEGNGKFGSIIGVKRCSLFYWILFLSFAVFCVYAGRYFVEKVKSQAMANLSRMSESFRISRQEQSVLNDILFKCFLGGIVAGMLGIGGAVILTPLMLQLRVDPIVATSTSNFLLILTSSTTSFLFTLSGEVRFDYALFYATLCGGASYIGSVYIREYVEKTRKLSLLIYFILGLMLVSFILLPINSYNHIVSDLKNGISIFEFKSFCN